MEYGAIDLHKQHSQIRIVDQEGRVVEEARVRTSRAAWAQVFGQRERQRIVVESSTESEWVAQDLEGLGHEVVVVDPNYLPMYGSRSRRVKTDRRDVAALAEANRTGTFRAAHRVSAAAAARRQALRIRRRLVATRSGHISLLRALLRQHGLRLASGSAGTVLRRLDGLAVPAGLAARLAPLRQAIEQTTALITAADQALHDTAVADPVAQRLMSVPGVGPVVALTFQATLDTPARFGGDARRASAYLGVVPSEASSGERQRKGRITKAGPPEMRALLVQAAWTVWRSKSPAGAPLRAWAQHLAARRGRKVAVVALARRLSRILFAVWRDDVEYAPRGRAGRTSNQAA